MLHTATIPKSEKICDRIGIAGASRSGKGFEAAGLVRTVYNKRTFIIDPQYDWNFGNSRPHRPNYVDFGDGRGNHVYYWNTGYIISDNPRKNTAIKYILSHLDQTNFVHVFRTSDRREIEYIQAMALSLGHLCVIYDEIYSYFPNYVDRENSELAAQIKGEKTSPSLFVDITNRGSHQAISSIAISPNYIGIPMIYRNTAFTRIFFNQPEAKSRQAAWDIIPPGQRVAIDKDGAKRTLKDSNDLASLVQGERVKVFTMFSDYVGNQNLKTFRY